MEISALKTSLALEVKKIRRQRIRGITRRRSESNARGACRIIGGNSTCRFCTIESYGNDSNTRKPYELKPRDIERRFFTWKQLIQRQQRKGFLHRTGDEKWYSTTTPRRKNITLSPVNRCHRPQH